MKCGEKTYPAILTLLLALTALTWWLHVPGASVDVVKDSVPTPSPLGVAFGSFYRGETFMDLIEELTIHSTKIYLYRWQIEREKGEYDWEIVDRFLGQLGPGEGSLIAVWSSSHRGTRENGQMKKGAPPEDRDAYYDFIFNLVRHCRGKIEYWQNDCEPNSPRFWEGTKEEFVSTLEVFHRAVKAADPAATVVVGGHSGIFTDNGIPDNQPFFDHIFRKARDSFDLFDIRLYGDPYTIPYRVEWFQRRMAELDCLKPIVCTEYGGPLPTQFPEGRELRRKYFDNRSRDEQLAMFKHLMNNRYLLPDQMRMFLEGCEGELEEKRHRIHCRDVVTRTVIALSSGVRKLWYWDLVNDPHPLFGKFRLVDRDFERRYPAFYAYQRMARAMRDATAVKRRAIRDRPNMYLFEIGRTDRDPLYVVWEKRDLFAGEDDPPTEIELALGFEKVRMTDVFGTEERKETDGGLLLLGLTDTPLFIEGN